VIRNSAFRVGVVLENRLVRDDLLNEHGRAAVGQKRFVSRLRHLDECRVLERLSHDKAVGRKVSSKLAGESADQLDRLREDHTRRKAGVGSKRDRLPLAEG